MSELVAICLLVGGIIIIFTAGAVILALILAVLGVYALLYVCSHLY